MKAINFPTAIQQRIITAIENTRRRCPAGYFENTLLQRTTAAKGSRYERTTPEVLEERIVTADWQPYESANVASGCTAFRAPIAGKLGMVALSSLPLDTELRLIDPKGTGQWNLATSGVAVDSVDYSVIIFGIEKGFEVVFTIHPGDPTPFKPVTELPAHIAEREAGWCNDRRIAVSFEEARALGYEFVKLE